MYKKDYQLPIY